MGVLKQSETNESAAAHSQVNLPSRDPFVQICKVCMEQGFQGWLGAAKADLVSPYQQVLLNTGGDLVAVVTLGGARAPGRFLVLFWRPGFSVDGCSVTLRLF